MLLQAAELKLKDIAALFLHAQAARKELISLLKNHGKEFFITLMITIAANLACMMVFFYLRKNGIMFREFDIARYTTIAVVFSAVIVCIIGIARHKKKNDTFEVVTLSTLISLVGSFIGSVSGAVISANIFGKIT